MNKEIIVDVVHGTTRWDVLAAFGVRRIGNAWHFPPPSTEPLQISGRDLERGFVSYACDPARLKEWAEFVLAASSLVTFDAEREQGGDALLERLWDAAFSDEDAARM